MTSHKKIGKIGGKDYIYKVPTPSQNVKIMEVMQVEDYWKEDLLQSLYEHLIHHYPVKPYDDYCLLEIKVYVEEIFHQVYDRKLVDNKPVVDMFRDYIEDCYKIVAYIPGATSIIIKIGVW